jgi:hypothetical protein
MTLQQSVQEVFEQLTNSLNQLSSRQYTQPSNNLSQATIGQHVRHIVELFICLENGYTSGTVNYENRKRDVLIETDKDFAMDLLKGIAHGLNKENKELLLEAGFDILSDEKNTIPTNYLREIVYNLEHTIHHMALIRVGINEVSDIILSEQFGVAPSTIKYRNTCAQ